jgi:DNA-binding transcriptional MerR regulator
MTKAARRQFKAHEFAKLAGVTVRALHHYDRLGLLKPSGYTGAGYRLYGERDFVRLQQIVTLKFIGLSLAEIRDLLERSPFDLPKRLRLQREALEARRLQLDLAISAIKRAEQEAAGGGAGWEAFARIIDVIEMHKNTEWMKKYYSDEQLAELALRWSPEVQQQATRDWAELVDEVEKATAAGEDPAGERAGRR